MVNPPPPDDQDARTQSHLAFLDTLIAHGMDLANRVHQQATSPAEPCSAPAELASAQTEPTPTPVTPETIALFDRISRAVRRTILLSRKLAEPLPLVAPIKPIPDRIATRQRIIREVEDTIHRKSGSADADSLEAELHERVESVDLDDDIGNRPVHEIIAELSRDLGIAGDWDESRFKRRTPEDIEALRARATRTSRPDRPKSGLPNLRNGHITQNPGPRPPRL